MKIYYSPNFKCQAPSNSKAQVHLTLRRFQLLSYYRNARPHAQTQNLTASLRQDRAATGSGGMGHLTKFLLHLWTPNYQRLQPVAVIQGAEISHASLWLQGIPRTNFQRAKVHVIKNSIYLISKVIKVSYLVQQPFGYKALSLSCRNVRYVWNL